MRVLMVARRSAIEERITTLNQLRHICMTADEPIRQRFEGLTPIQLTKKAAALKPRRTDAVRYATLLTIRTLGQRVRSLRLETRELDAALKPLITATAPGLLAVFGVGFEIAARLLVAAGGQPRTTPQRSGVGAPLRRRADPRVFGQDDPASVEPRR